MPGTPNILVVDDEAAVRATIKLVLEANGFNVMAVGNGHTSRKAIQMSHYDAAVVDIFMPDMDGFEIISLLRAEQPRLPIIAVSGMIHTCVYRDRNGNTPDFLSMAQALGATRALQKPFKPDDLVRTVREAIAASG